MSQVKGVGLWTLVVFVVISTMSIVAMGEITLHTDGGEAQWWYRGEHDEVCTSGADYCSDSDHWGVELATYFEGDWAYVGLEVARRFHIEDIDKGSEQTLGFFYTMTEYPIAQVDSGPSMAFWIFEENSGTHYLAVSAAAPVVTNPSGICSYFEASEASWWWGTVDAVSEEVDVSSFELKSLANGDSFTHMQIALANTQTQSFKVEAAMVLMGEAGQPIGGSNGSQLVGTGKVVVDDVVLTWGAGANGGTYHMEPAWDETITFDDWAQAPLPGNEPPREWDKWCMDPNYCYHCLEVDDQNLWGIVNESDLGSATPAGVLPFDGSSPYAIYFGDPISANYDMGEAAVGVVCSPMNELNPGDEFVSIAFDYFREVEQYMGAYDWTYVQIWFDDWNVASGDYDPFATGNENPGDIRSGDGNANGAPICDDDPDLDEWKTIWYKDSSYPNEGSWAQAVITHYLDEDETAMTDDENRIIIPPHATRMQIRFGFNSVDGATNAQFGWMIDNIVKEHSPDPVGCTIATDHLWQATIGEKYDFALSPQVIDGASTGARNWAITSVIKDGQRTTLPRRIALDPMGRLYGEPDPGTTGTYEITFVLTCFDGRPDEKTLLLNVRSPTGDGAVSEIATQDFDDCTSWQNPTDSNYDECVQCNQDRHSDSNSWTVEGDPLPNVAGGTGGIYLPNLWHETGHVKYGLTGAAEAEYCDVAYFGQDDNGTPTDSYDPNYKGGRMKGCLYSPFFPISEAFDNEELIVGFKSWRNVEYLAGGTYDKTTVEVRFEGGSWQEIWGRSSNDPSVADWTWQEVDTGILLQEGVKIQLRFSFDSVDGYNNAKAGEAYGWMIDEISLYAGTAVLSISTCPKDEASVGEYYDEELHASGGSDIAPIWELASGQLPPGLDLVEQIGDEARTAFIRGTPRSAGTFTFTIRIRDANWDELATRTCTITVGEEVTLLWEDFESDPYWSQSGLWHFTTDVGVTGVDEVGAGNHAAYYGKDDANSPNYNTSTTTSGMLTLVAPVVDLSGVDAIKIFFDYWRGVESTGSAGYDQTRIEVKLGMGDWVPIWELDSGDASQAEWIRDTSVGPFLTNGATTMLVRFVFDSGDRWYNNQVGWLIDNLKIHSALPGSASALSAMASHVAAPRGVPAELQVINLPNPVTDVHTTTFMVRSADVEAMRIEIYDISGALVFKEEIPGNELVWHTENDYGEYLSNGIYLYHAYVLMDGQWTKTGSQKLVILR